MREKMKWWSIYAVMYIASVGILATMVVECLK